MRAGERLRRGRVRAGRAASLFAVFAALLFVLYGAGAPFVQRAVTLDLDGDGRDELVLLVWKRGSYGPHRPTWAGAADGGLSQHLFIYARRETARAAEAAAPLQRMPRLRPVWMSSALGFRVRAISRGREIPGTGRQSIAVTGADGTVSRWGWLTWGLVRLDG